MTTGSFILKMLNYKRKFKSDLPRHKQICWREVISGNMQYEPPRLT